jgi:prevent-host-death family protein
MTKIMAVTEAKANLSSLLDEVENGEDIEITRRGVTVARLSAARGPHSLIGRFRGVAMSAAPEEELFSTGVKWNLE